MFGTHCAEVWALSSVGFGLERMRIYKGHMRLIRDQNGSVEGIDMLS